MSVIAETGQAALTGQAAAFSRNLLLIQQELAEVAGRVNAAQVSDIVAELGLADRIFVAGAGRSGLVLKMAAMRLMHLGMTVHVVGETTAPAIRSGDLLLVASGSGTTASVVKAAEVASTQGARVAAYTTDPTSPLAALANVVAVVPAAQKTDHRSAVSRQYSGSLFEQALFAVTEAVFHSLWQQDAADPEELWLRHANLE